MKEISQILRNKQLIFILVFPPTIQLLIFGLALSPDVQNLRLGVLDYSNPSTSRELVAALTVNGVFRTDTQQLLGWGNRSPIADRSLSEQVRRGEITTGLIIPSEFNRNLKSDASSSRVADVQVLIDGVDANTAGIAIGYATQRQLQQAESSIVTPGTFLYNFGLIPSWFIVPGVLGLVLNLGSLLVSTTSGALALSAFAIALLLISTHQFRTQLS